MDESSVDPAVTAVHALPLHFWRVVPAVTLSILKLGAAVSISPSSAAPASVSYVISWNVSSVAPVRVLTVESVGMSLTEAISTLTCRFPLAEPPASRAETVNAGRVPKAFAAACQRNLSPLETSVDRGVTAVHDEPVHFSSVVEPVTLSILKVRAGFSTSVSLAASASSP